MFPMMKRLSAILLAALVCLPLAAKYTDHRGYNVDSLERVVGEWTPVRIDTASVEDLMRLNIDYRDLMHGYNQINGVKSRYYARRALSISRARHWERATADACRYIGQHFWAEEQYDSAMYYYREALLSLQRISSGEAVSPSNPEKGYSRKELDDDLSALFGSIGNVYNMMDSIPKAMEYYAEAGKIFDRYGWNESNSVLYYNIGETWVGEEEYGKAREAYERSLAYATEAGDSLLVANACKGLGGLYMDTGKTWKALRYLREAERYYTLHDDQEFRARMENLDFMGQVLSEQRKQLFLLVGALVVAILLGIGTLLLLGRLRRTRREQGEAAAVMDETLEDLRQMTSEAQHPEDAPILSERERDVLRLLSNGYTAPQIADALCLSPETIKWYRKKLLVKFDVSNTPELISRVKDLNIL